MGLTKKESKLKPKLTTEFLETVAESVEAVGWSVDAIESIGFYEHLCEIAGVRPRSLHLTLAE